MNNNLKELIATCTTKGLFGQEKFDKQMFAELLIKECAEVVYGGECEMSYEQRLRISIYHDIKSHFGLDDGFMHRK